MTVEEIVAGLELKVLNGADMRRDISGGYASDLLSCVMAGAKEGNLWITLQAHPNVVAVASLLNLSGVIITEGTEPDHDTLVKAEEHKVALLSTTRTSYEVCGRLWALGIAGG